MFVPARCATVLFPSGSANDPARKHLFVLLTDPWGPAKQVLMVPVCSVVPAIPHDEACLVDVGDHPFVKHESFIAYARCRVEAADDLVTHVCRGYLVENSPASEVLVQRIVSGLKQSRFTKPFALKFYQDFASG